MNVVRLPQLPWSATGNLEITFPDGWEIELCHMAGYDRAPLNPALIKEAVLKPIGTQPISEAARGKKEVVIIFDDMSRPTRVAGIVPHVLEELAEAGITDDQIRFVCALGCHGALTRHDFVKKLGEDVVARFPIFNHNIVGNHNFVGTTSLGTDLYINSEVMQCDFKIGIGSIVPHGFAGYGGGAKIILPGIASFETILAMHDMRSSERSSTSIDVKTMGCVLNNSIRRNIEEAAAMVGLDIKIDAIVNMWGETVSLYAGSPELAFNEAIKEGREHYLTPRADDCDVVVTNTFAKANEGEGGVITGLPSVTRRGGDVVLIANAPEGHVVHYLFGNWGSIRGGDSRLEVQLPAHVGRLIVFNEYRDQTAAGFFAPREKVLLLDKWEDVVRVLAEKHGEHAKVGVYSSAEIQYCDETR